MKKQEQISSPLSLNISFKSYLHKRCKNDNGNFHQEIIWNNIIEEENSNT